MTHLGDFSEEVQLLVGVQSGEWEVLQPVWAEEVEGKVCGSE